MLSNQQKENIENVMQQGIAGSDTFVVDIKYSSANKIDIFLDAESGMTIEKCTKLARAINKHLEEFEPALDYELEVSSAGLEHPLKMLRQYKKNIGRNLEVHLADGILIEGKLLNADEQGFTIEYQLPKSKHKKEQKTFTFDEVKEVFVGVSFK